MDRGKRRLERIHTEVSLAHLLQHYGYRVQAQDREQQFSCDLHGDGSDSKPSARLYPETNSFYCWACGRSRDSIALVQEKEGLDFVHALSFLEKLYGLPSLPWESESAPVYRNVIGEQPPAIGSFEVEESRVKKFLTGLTKDRELPLSSLLTLWEAYDRIMVEKENGDTTAQDLASMLMKVRTMALNLVRTNEGFRQVHSQRPPLGESTVC